MKIKLKSCVVMRNSVAPIGATVSVSDAKGRALIAAGRAAEVKERKPKTKTKEEKEPLKTK